MAQSISIFGRLVGALFVVTALIWPAASRAAEFSITPMFQEVEIGDEERVMTEVTLTNTTAVSAVFRLAAYDFGNLDDSGGVAFLGVTNDLGAEYTLARWMMLDQNEVVLAPGASATVTITIENDATLSPGGHYGAVVFQSIDTALGQPDNTIAINHMVASLIFAKKIGGAVQSIELVATERLGGWFHLPEPGLRFKSTGNVHVIPRGVVRVVDPAGRVAAQGVINEASAIILPETTRFFPIKLHSIERAWLPGWYTFGVAYRHDAETSFTDAETRFFFFPPVTVGCIALAGLAFFGWRRWQKRRIHTTPSP